MGLFGKAPSTRVVQDLLERLAQVERALHNLDMDVADLSDRFSRLHGRVSARARAENENGGGSQVAPPLGKNAQRGSQGPSLDPISQKILERRARSLAVVNAPIPTVDE